MKQLNTRIGQIDSLIEKTSILEELSNKFDSMDEINKTLQEKMNQNDIINNKIMTDLTKAENKMDQSAKTMKRLATMAGIADENGNIGDDIAGGSRDSLKGGMGRPGDELMPGMSKSDYKKLTESMLNFDTNN